MRLYALFLAIACVFCGYMYAVETAAADWRWTTPKLKVEHKTKPYCDSWQCHKRARQINKIRLRLKVARFNLRKEREWRKWTTRPIADCTWYGESGYGPEYDPKRYTMPNKGGSGAYGKFQFMPATYRANAKYFDWSALDQEIAARREYWKHGTSPWSNC